jgi:hypothetical protein
MVRSTAICWQIGLAVAALGSPMLLAPALADTTLAKKVETGNVPLEPKAVQVIMMPPASDTPVASPYAETMKDAPVILVRTVGSAATAPLRQEPATPTLVEPAGNASFDEPQPDLMDSARFMVQPAGSASIAQPRPEPANVASAKVQPANVQEETVIAKSPPLSEPRAPVASPPPPAAIAAIAPPPQEPAKAESSPTLAAIPALPRRSPFRQTALQTPFKSEFVENGPMATGTFQQQPVEPKSKSPFRFLTNLWPGNKQANSPAESSPSPSTVAASQPPADAAVAGGEQQTAEKPNLLDKLQFWKKN